MSIELFAKKYLTNIRWPTEKQKEKELWDVEGILKKKSNKKLKFDIRPFIKQNTGVLGKIISSSTKANKIVFENETHWIIADVEELHNYILTHKLKIINLEDIIKILEWNINIKK